MEQDQGLFNRGEVIELGCEEECEESDPPLDNNSINVFMRWGTLDEQLVNETAVPVRPDPQRFLSLVCSSESIYKNARTCI
jgi:hypothetical protein